MYNYVGHVKKFGFEWNHNSLGFKSGTKIDNSDSKKKKKKNLEIQEKISVLINREYGIW